MTKKELMKHLEDMPDNTQILLWQWNGKESKAQYLNLCCNPEIITENGVPGLLIARASGCFTDFKSK